MWFPISSRVAVSPYGSAGYEYVTQFSVEQATHFNLLVLSQSNVVAGCSMAAMENLLNPKLW